MNTSAAMQTAGYLIIVLATVLGVSAAVTAYAPRLDLDDARLVGLTLNDPAGATRADDGKLVPLLDKGTVLTAAHLTTLREAGATRVRVKEFAPGRWAEAPLFGLACLGMLGGAALVRLARRRDDAARGDAAAGAAAATPESILAHVAGTVEGLRRDLDGLPDDPARLERVLGDLGGLQRGALPAFAGQRDVLVARASLAEFAQVMDRFAGAERQLNRAWSAAADGVLEEARLGLDRAAILLEETSERLVSAAPRGTGGSS
jgi:hypothetical protein